MEVCYLLLFLLQASSNKNSNKVLVPSKHLAKTKKDGSVSERDILLVSQTKKLKDAAVFSFPINDERFI